MPHKAAFSAEAPLDRALVADSIRLVGLDGFAERAFDSLSGGEKQRAIVARALVQQPQILILDEPTNHLDIRYQRDILRLTRRLGISVLASFHDLNLAASYCDRLYLLHHGAITAAGTPAEILTPALIESVFQVKARVTPHPDTARPCITYEP
jgi:iron complex transport system ATP-binding protein